MATFARVNGIALHYADEGPRHARAIVFSNSLGCDFRIWDGVAAHLAGYRLIRYDKRGHGLSEATPAPYAMEDHIADIAALMDHLKVANAVFVGLSVGGMIAQGLAASRPDLVARLALCDTAAKIGTRDMWEERIATVRTKGIAAIAPGVLEKWFTPAFRRPDNPDFIGYSAMLTRTTVEGYAGTAAAIRDSDFTVSTGREPHAARGREILRNHAGIKALAGRNPWSAPLILGVVSVQTATGWQDAATMSAV